MSEPRTRLIAGCMTGTSLDGLDVALVKITGTGLDMMAELLGHHAMPLPDALRATLMSLASGQAHEPIVYMRAARALGELHADGIEQLLASGLVPPLGSPGSLDLVSAHGQTIWHAPRDGKEQLGGGPKSWQLFDPWPIVRRLKVPVCYDLRQADLIAGGEGAPLTPIADWVMYASESNKRVIVNLGGVANVTILPRRGDDWEITGGDIGPCNLLIDGLVQRLFPGERYDRDGHLSSIGGFEDDLSMPILQNPFFQKKWPRSAGREDFTPAWIDQIVQWAQKPIIQNKLSDHEVIGSALYTVAVDIITRYCRSIIGKPEIVLAGGGSKNPNMVKLIQDELRRYEGVGTCLLSDDLGIPCEAREAMAWAVLGALSQDGVPVSLPQVTGAKSPGVAGVWAGAKRYTR